jgi:hypothetical protein
MPFFFSEHARMKRLGPLMHVNLKSLCFIKLGEYFSHVSLGSIVTGKINAGLIEERK